jgi:hypothetical protein
MKLSQQQYTHSLEIDCVNVELVSDDLEAVSVSIIK